MISDSLSSTGPEISLPPSLAMASERTLSLVSGMLPSQHLKLALKSWANQDH